MTITNHIRNIQNFADLLIENIDERKYRHAHHIINAIECEARLAHEHVDKLQNVSSYSDLPRKET